MQSIFSSLRANLDVTVLCGLACLIVVALVAQSYLSTYRQRRREALWERDRRKRVERLAGGHDAPG